MAYLILGGVLTVLLIAAALGLAVGSADHTVQRLIDETPLTNKREPPWQ